MSTGRWLKALVPSLALLGAGCGPDTFQRMAIQPRDPSYGQEPFFEDQRAMRAPPRGTVPREWPIGSVEFATGQVAEDPDAGYVQRIPVALTRATVERGRSRFEIYCAACHGVLGDGDSLVARNMALRPPPSLLTLTDRPDGYIYRVITQGRGLMPGYASPLSPHDRWAVVAYVRALQRSQRARLEDAPPEVRGRLLTEARDE